MKKLVSVIIPVYNVEAYIEKCVESLLEQTYTNFEALIVDDGSPDSSIQLAKQKIGNDPRFRFFEKENGGQGTARNLALDNAKGEYITFLDSDDYYDQNYLSVMTESIISSDADICMCNTNFIDENDKIIKVYKNNLPIYLSKQDYLLSYRSISNYMWDKIFKANCFDNFRFNPLIRTYEDVHILFRIMYQKTMISIDSVLYNYVQRTGSTMNSFPESYIDDRYNIYLEVEKFYYKHLSDNSKYKDHLSHHFLNNFIFDCAINIVKYSKNCHMDIQHLLSKEGGNLFTYKNIITSKTLPIKNKLLLLLLKLSPKVFKVFMNRWLNLKYGGSI
ncbi:glycosyltransferase family 2 protein [Pseudoalteromonas sp. AOP31-A2-14]|uniref:glycosyltransferase family 2 protein n=1 Tax=Pseudoalteromonas sp. AOP31-A2-14 TaxID=3457695 RepID=UPI004035557D